MTTEICTDDGYRAVPINDEAAQDATLREIKAFAKRSGRSLHVRKYNLEGYKLFVWFPRVEVFVEEK